MADSDGPRDPRFDPPAERFLQNRDWATADGQEVLRQLPRKLRKRAMWLRSRPGGDQYAWTDPSADLDDAIQETVRRVIGAIHEFRERGAGRFKGWAYVILKNVLLDMASKLRKGPAVPILRDLHANRVVDRLHIRAIFDRMLEENPASDYPRLLEMDAEGLSSREGAGELGISVANFEKRKQRARARFRELHGELRSV